MRALLLLVCAGCRQLFGFESVAVEPLDVAADTTEIDGPGGTPCYGTAPIRICFAEPPTGAMLLTGTFDSGDCATVVTLSDLSEVCVLAAGTITATSHVTFVGPRR
ncbi:MAG: hypothetical protein H0V17_09190, partial [Deltaproteobacteria bacterium]|nr:hypothetical protein [Deltaproteobacteria bacterium]